MSKSIAIITLSTRTPRVGPHVASFVQSIIAAPAAAANLTLVPIDLKDFNLPVFDEPVLPAQVSSTEGYTKPHTRAWSAAIKPHAGYVLVTTEYNYSIPAAAKNAVDYIQHEWKGKPLAIVSYGVHGGNWASEHLAHVLSKQSIGVVATRPALGFKGGFGPDTIAAATKGELGAETREIWEKEQKENILKAFGEVVEGIKDGETA